MNDRWIESFLTAAEMGSFAKAATAVHISPQAFAQQIDSMERELGISLFSRSSSGVNLTMAGQEFYKGAMDLKKTYKETLARCYDAPDVKHSFRIPVNTDFFYPKFTETVYAEYENQIASHPEWPSLVFDMVEDPDYLLWINKLVEGDYDLVEYYSIHESCPGGVHFESLGDMRLMCMVNRNHPIVDMGHMRPEDMQGLQFHITHDSYLHRLKRYLAEKLIDVKFIIAPSNRYDTINICNEGGIVLMNDDCVDEFPGFAFIPIDFDLHVRYGLACAAEDMRIFSNFFAISHQVYDETHPHGDPYLLS